MYAVNTYTNILCHITLLYIHQNMAKQAPWGPSFAGFDEGPGPPRDPIETLGRNNLMLILTCQSAYRCTLKRTDT